MRRTPILAAVALALAPAVGQAATAPPAPAVLQLQITGPNRALGGTEGAYRVQVRNTGAVTPARDVQVSVPIPADAFLASRPAQTTVSGRTVIVRLGTLAPGTSRFRVIGLRWERNASGQRCVEGYARSDTAARVSTARACTRITPRGTVDPVAVTRVRVDGPERLTAGRVGQFRITVTNTAAAAAQGTGIGLVLAPGMAVARQSGGLAVSGDTVTWTVGRIPAGASRRVEVSLRSGPTIRGLRCNVAYAGAANATRLRRSGLCTQVVPPAG
ncbi:MAG: hypothetical protein MUE51_05615 [Thermoleophilia bacterium]|jgi:hypothetical protein|nr:hypothetical protein [Thermoleophilia bacterium]